MQLVGISAYITIMRVMMIGLGKYFFSDLNLVHSCCTSTYVTEQLSLGNLRRYSFYLKDGKITAKSAFVVIPWLSTNLNLEPHLTRNSE